MIDRSVDAAPRDPFLRSIRARAWAPDLARGGMLLLIALANVHAYSFGHPAGPRGYPADVTGVDRAVALVQTALVDGRAYPLFGLLFGYGIVQLTRRRAAAGADPSALVRLVRRRSWWMVLIGLVHGVLLWSGDIIGAYGVLGLLMAGLLVRGTDRRLVVTGAAGAVLVGALYSFVGLPVPGAQALLPSMALADPGAALVTRAAEWVGIGVAAMVLSVFGAVAAGALAARRGVLDEPGRHLPLLRRTAVAGLAVAVLGGLPLALQAAGLWSDPSFTAMLAAGSLHALSGYAGGLGYAALFGLWAARLRADGRRPGPAARALRACGQRSMSSYLAQSVAFVALFPAWTLGLGDDARLWQLAAAAVGTWLVVLLVADASARRGLRGPAETLLRRLTYGTAAGVPAPADRR